VTCSATGSTASRYDELELTSGLVVPSGQDDVVSTTALAGSFASDAAAAGLVESASLVTDTAVLGDAADAEVHS